MIRGKLQRSSVFSERFAYFSIKSEYKTEIDIGVEVIRFEANGFVEAGRGFGELAQLGANDAKIVVCLGIIRLQTRGLT